VPVVLQVGFQRQLFKQCLAQLAASPIKGSEGSSTAHRVSFLDGLAATYQALIADWHSAMGVDGELCS
jgi:hypothetical protein